MGIGQSKDMLPQQEVFSTEFRGLNQFFKDTLNADGTLFNNKRYNVFLNDQCNQLTLITKKRLERHPKFHLRKLRDQIYVVPNDELRESKSDICNAISVHYARILRLLYIVKMVLDLEHQGDRSMAGIMLRNIETKADMVQLHYCGGPQEELGTYDKGVDFSKLVGLEAFVQDLLTTHESNVFLAHFKELLGKNNKTQLKRIICRDVLVEPARYRKLYDDPTIKCAKQGGGLLVKVTPGHPIFNWQYCTQPKSYTAKNNPEITKSIAIMRKRYRNNIKEIEQTLQSLVVSDEHGETILRDVTQEELSRVETNAKRAIVIFFLESIIQFGHVRNVMEKYAVNRNA
jgi:hypothetical protein